jgi:two-component system, NtrC family, response regulator GlrR
VHTQNPLRYGAPFKTLRRVSGQLRGRLRRDRPTALPESSEPLSLLIVDDEKSICLSLKEYFAHTGYAVDTAADVDDAERLIDTGHHELLIQDIRMGVTEDFGGLQIIKFARTHRPGMRIVVLTAHGTGDVENEARVLGVDAFLRKPQPLARLAEVVRGLIASPHPTSDPQRH